VHIGCISICCTYEKPSKINLAQDALDGMAYYIFLKSLGSLEEFRKKPHIKIPPKSPPTNFQSLGIFKNLIFIRKRIFLQLSAQTAQQPSGLLAPSDPASQAGPPGRAPSLPPSLTRAGSSAASSSCAAAHGHRAALLLRHGATPTDAPSLTQTCAFTRS
jgi:hypothetical protein